ncbi:MAG: cysteine ABC transporter substrate-binding protein [Cellulosilyticaceae bacterium]
MNKLRKIALGLVCILGIGLLGGCGNSTTAPSGSVESIKQRDKVRIGVFSDKPPFGYVDQNGENQGFDVYIAKRLTKELLGDETKVEFVLVEAASRVAYLESDKVDMILANFTVTPERSEKVDFANPYMKVALGVVSPNGTPITSVDQLKDKTLIVNKGTTADAYFTQNYPEIKLLKFDQNTEAFEALKDGRGQALAHDNTLLLAWARENEGYSVGVPTLGSLDTIAPAVKKGNTELQAWINETFEKLGEEQFMRQAYDATLKPVYGDSVKPEDIIIEGGKLTQ